MELEILLPIETIDLRLKSNNTWSSTPYISAHSSPQEFNNTNFFYSAPNSPSKLLIPFHWEQTPGIPKIQTLYNGDQDFEFDFGGQVVKTSLVSADDLFDQGRIKPLKPPPRLQTFNADPEHQFRELGLFKSAVRSPRSPIFKGKNIIKNVFSPRSVRGEITFRKDFDPFEVALKEASLETESDVQQQQQKRGRKSKFVRKITRSLSPFRFSDVSHGHEQEKDRMLEIPVEAKASFAFLRAYRKLKLKDLLMFRRSSEKMKKFETLPR